MKRILLTVEYDGSAYAGWQRQINGLAVQQVLEEVLASACRHPVTVTGSSRTDAGVHARMQMVHFDTGCTIPPDKYPFILNNLLPPDIRSKSIDELALYVAVLSVDDGLRPHQSVIRAFFILDQVYILASLDRAL